MSQRKRYEVSENSDPWTNFLGTMLRMCWGGGRRPGSLRDRSPRAGPWAWAASPTSWGNTHSTKPGDGKDGQRGGGLSTQIEGFRTGKDMEGETREDPGWKIWELLWVCVCVCVYVCARAHTHMCRNHQYPPVPEQRKHLTNGLSAWRHSGTFWR